MIEYHSETSSTCVVAFATEANEYSEHMQAYEFGGVLSAFPISHVLVKDEGDWYHRGFENMALNASIDFVQGLRNRYAKVVTIGLSYGAHGALLIGKLARVDLILAISPVVDVARWAQKWNKSTNVAYCLAPFAPHPPLHCFVSDGEETDLDYEEARSLEPDWLTVIPGQSHGGLARHMRDAGWFQQFFADAA